MEMKKLVLPAAAAAALGVVSDYALDAYYDAHKMAEKIGAELARVLLVIERVSDRVKSGECSIERVDPKLIEFDIVCNDEGVGYTSSGVTGGADKRSFLFLGSIIGDAIFEPQFNENSSHRNTTYSVSINDTTCITNSEILGLISCRIGDGPSVVVNDQSILGVIQDSGILEAISALQALAVKESHK
jgi:hypothetical protein